MGQRFVACDREQSFLMPPDVREWLPAGHLAWFVIDAVEQMDLATFYAAYRRDGRSRPAYDPAMMVAVLVYAYAREMRSSRLIERACEEDVAFRVLAAQQRPDHATIARFVERHQDAIAGLFGEVLELCAKSGLVRVGVIAVDGTKVAANASRDANCDYGQLAREILEEAKATDAAEDEFYGEARGDELPAQRPRRPRVAARGQAPPRRRARPSGAGGPPRSPHACARGQAPPRRGAADRGARQRRLRALPRDRADEKRPPAGRAFAAQAYTPPDTPQGHINLTDPDSRVVKGLRGFIQGYNAQAVSNEHQVVLAAEIMTAGGDFGHLEPMVEAAQREVRTAGIDETPEVLLADAGYWHQEQMHNVVDRGIQVLTRPDASKRKTARPGWTGGLYAFMRRVLATETGSQLYRRRQPMIEPIFGQIKHNRGIDRFSRRGRAAVRAEWRLICATHNLLKLHRHALTAA